MGLIKAIEKASNEVEQMDIFYWLDSVESKTSHLSDYQRLTIAGAAYELLAKICAERSELSIRDWEERFDPNYQDYYEDLFDDLIAKVTHQINLDSVVEVPRPAKAQPSETSVKSQPIELPQISVDDLLAIEPSHTEDINGWSQAIANYLKSVGGNSTLTVLSEVVQLTRGELLVTALLGDFKLVSIGDNFYSHDWQIYF